MNLVPHSEHSAMASPALPMLPVAALAEGFDLAPLVVVSPEEKSGLSAATQTQVAGQGGLIREMRRQGFQVGSVRLMIGYEDSSELTDIPPIHHLPNAPHWFIGFINLHGRLIPVFDLLLYLGLEANVDEKRMLLILGHDDDAAGVMINGLPQRLRWSSEDETGSGMAPPALAPHVKTTCLLGDEIWFDLDCPSLLNGIEQMLKASQ